MHRITGSPTPGRDACTNIDYHFCQYILTLTRTRRPRSQPTLPRPYAFPRPHALMYRCPRILAVCLVFAALSVALSATCLFRHLSLCLLPVSCLLCVCYVSCMFLLCVLYVSALCLCVCYVSDMCLLCVCYVSAMCLLCVCYVSALCLLCVLLCFCFV